MQKLIAAIPDALIVGGVASISYGASLIYPAAGFIVGGALAVAFAFMSAKPVAKAAE